jgi:hypothetical protein
LPYALETQVGGSAPLKGTIHLLAHLDRLYLIGRAIVARGRYLGGGMEAQLKSREGVLSMRKLGA